MSQNVVDFSTDPSGTQLLDNLLTPMKQNILTNNSGTSRPSYAVAHTTWTDTTTTPWVLKYFDGTDDITLGTINATTNVFTISGSTLNKVDATTAPTINDDVGDGYSVGSQWIDVTNDLGYVCLDATAGAAIWKLTTLTTAVVLAGGTYTGKITTVASASGGAGLNVPHGTAPSSPSNGDFWSTTAGFFARVNGATQQLLSLIGGTLTGKLTTVATGTGGAGFNLPHGTAPSSPADGDVWTTTSGAFVRVNGATVALGAASPFTESFQSTAITMTAGAIGTVAHGLSGRPKVIYPYIRCKTAELNYAVGDEVLCPWQTNGYGINIASSGTANIRYMIQNNLRISNATSVGDSDITYANWELFFRAYY